MFSMVEQDWEATPICVVMRSIIYGQMTISSVSTGSGYDINTSTGILRTSDILRTSIICMP